MPSLLHSPLLCCAMDVARSLSFASPSARAALLELSPCPQISLRPGVFGCFRLRKSGSTAEKCRSFQSVLGLAGTEGQWRSAKPTRFVASSKQTPYLQASAARLTKSPQSWKSWLSDEEWVDSLLHSNQLAGYGDFFTSLGVSEGTATAKVTSTQIWSAEGRWDQARKAISIVYRALLIGAIGLSFSSPVFACPAASETSVALPEKLVEKDVQEQEGSDTGTFKSSEVFDDEFWTGLETSKNSVEQLLKTYLERHPTNIKALECLAHLLVEKNDMQRALKVFEKLEQLDPEELEWKFMKAQAHECNGELELAKKGFEGLLKLQPFSSRALQGLVIVMGQIGEGGSALGILEASMARATQENKLVEARNLRMLIGQFHTIKGNLQEALEHYKELIDEDPNDFRPYLCEGIIYSVLGEKDMAERQFTNYRKLCPKDFPNRKLLDELMVRAKNEGRKVHDLKQKASTNDTVGEDIDTAKQSSEKSEPESLVK